jgi:hypothetical protein
MNSRDEADHSHDDSITAEPGRGISLSLLYCIIALALFAAIGIALFIVLPFYHRR